MRRLQQRRDINNACCGFHDNLQHVGLWLASVCAQQPTSVSCFAATVEFDETRSTMPLLYLSSAMY